MCKVPALCIDHVEHEEHFHAKTRPLRGGMCEGNERSVGVGDRLADNTLRHGDATTETELGEGKENKSHTQKKRQQLKTNLVLLCVNESSIEEVRALSPAVTALIF